jgi:hypothetical protein
MEQEIDLIRFKGKITIDKLKRKVNYIWNRIPKKLCAKVVNKFNDLVKTVYDNKGNKENNKNRKEKKKLKACIPLKTKHRFFNKFFDGYEDDISRIAYSEKTLVAIRAMYKTFLKSEISFYKKVIVAIDAYKRRSRSIVKGISNEKTNNYCSDSSDYIKGIIKIKDLLLEGIDSMNEDNFWDLFSSKVKENLICNETLTNKNLKIENLIANNPHEQNLKIYEIINRVKNNIEFSEAEKDVEAFYNKIKEFINQENITTNASLTAADTSMIDISEISICDDEEICHDDELNEYIFTEKKRKRK